MSIITTENYTKNESIPIIRGASIAKMKKLDLNQLGELAARSSLAQCITVPTTLVGAVRQFGISLWYARNAMAELEARGDIAPAFDPEAQVLLPPPVSIDFDATWVSMDEAAQADFVAKHFDSVMAAAEAITSY